MFTILNTRTYIIQTAKSGIYTSRGYSSGRSIQVGIEKLNKTLNKVAPKTSNIKFEDIPKGGKTESFLNEAANEGLAMPTLNGALKVEIPATGELFSLVQNTTELDVVKAIKVARQASQQLRERPLFETVKFLECFKDNICKNRETYVKFLMVYSGKTKKEANIEIDEAIDVIRLFSKDAFEKTGEIFDGLTPGTQLKWIYKPVTYVSGQFGVSNFVMSILLKHLMPSITAKTSQVVKTPESGGLPVVFLLKDTWDQTADMEKKPWLKNTFPLVVGGKEIGKRLVESKEVGVLAVTGSTESIHTINEQAASSKYSLILEGVGLNVVVVDFQEASFNHFLKSMKTAICGMGARRCTTPHVLIIPKKYEQAVFDLLELVARSGAGYLDDDDENIIMCAQANSNERDNLNHYIVQASKQAGVSITEFPINLPVNYKSGFFSNLTIIKHSNLSTVPKSGCFGPAFNLFTYENENEIKDVILPWVSNQEFALSNAIFTDSANLQNQFLESSPSGVINFNNPPNGNPVGVNGFGPGTYSSGQTQGKSYAAGKDSRNAYLKTIFIRSSEQEK